MRCMTGFMLRAKLIMRKEIDRKKEREREGETYDHRGNNLSECGGKFSILIYIYQ